MPGWSDQDNGKKRVIKAGQRCRLGLPGNPATGYSWTFESRPDETILALVKEWFEPFAKSPPLIGSGGTQNWSFRAINPGKTSFTLRYKRPWENQAPLKSYRMVIEVVSL